MTLRELEAFGSVEEILAAGPRAPERREPLLPEHEGAPDADHAGRPRTRTGTASRSRRRRDSSERRAMAPVGCYPVREIGSLERREHGESLTTSAPDRRRDRRAGVARRGPRPTMRVDYYHTGNDKEERFSLDRVVIEPLPWAGQPGAPARQHQPRQVLLRGASTRPAAAPLYSRGFAPSTASGRRRPRPRR